MTQPNIAAMSDRDLAVMTYQQLKSIDEQLKRLDQRGQATDSRVASLEQTQHDQARDMSELRQQYTGMRLDLERRIDQAHAKGKEAFDMADKLADDMQVDDLSGKRVPLRVVFVSELAKLRALGQRAIGVLAVLVLVEPFIVEAIRRWLWP